MKKILCLLGWHYWVFSDLQDFENGDAYCQYCHKEKDFKKERDDMKPNYGKRVV